MEIRAVIKGAIEKITNTRIYRTLPRGVDVAQDIRNSLPNFRARVVFDIGANVGQSAKVFLAMFPLCHVDCFEPASETFAELRQSLKQSSRVDCHRLAFGSSSGKGKMVLHGHSVMSFLLDESSDIPLKPDMATEPVDVATVDEFCSARNIDRIGYLKIDTEGGDLDVLKGAEGMLGEQRIDLVQVEAGMNATNHRHVPLEALKEFLEPLGYFLFGIYEQMHEWPTDEPHLRRTNLVFVSQQVIASNTIPTTS